MRGRDCSPRIRQPERELGVEKKSHEATKERYEQARYLSQPEPYHLPEDPAARKEAVKQLTTKIHAITGGPNEGQITFAFAGSEEANGVYELAGEGDEYCGMPVFEGGEGRKVKYSNRSGHWVLWVGGKALYSQPLNPRSPAPTAQGWQCFQGLPPAPQATFSWQREVVMHDHRGGWWA